MPSLFRNTFYTGLSQGWQMLMAIVLFKVATTGLGERGFGQYMLATTLMYFVLLSNDFGLNTLVTREIATRKNQGSSILGHSFGLKLILIPVSVILLFGYLFLTRYDPETKRVILIFALYGLTSSFTQLAYGVFRAHERMEYEALVSITEKTISTGLCVLVIVLDFGVISFSSAFAAAGWISLFFAFALIRKRIHPFRVLFDFKAEKRLFKNALVFGCAMFITSVYDKVAVLMLSWMQNMAAVGFYGAAQKLVSFTSLIPTIFATAFFPRFAATSKNRNELSRVFTIGLQFLLMIAVPLVCGVFLLADRLIFLFADPQYAASVRAMRILAFPAGILFVNLFWASLYGASGHQRSILLIEIIGLFCNVVANWLLIPRHSYIGAAWATLITESLVLCLASVWAFARIVRMTEWFFIPKILFAAGIMSLFLIRFPRFPLIPAALMAVALYLTLLILTRTLRLDQLKNQLAGLR